MSTTTANRGSSGVSRLAMMQARFQAKQLVDRENKLINFLEERQEAAVRRINAGRESNHSANSLTSSSYSSSNNSVNGGRPRTTLSSRTMPPAVEKSSPVGWDKSYPLKPVVTPIGYPSNHHLPPARPPPAHTGGGSRTIGGGSPTKFNKYSGNYGPKSRGTSLDRSYAELQRAQRQLFLSRTKSSNQLIPRTSEEEEIGFHPHNARNRLRTRRSSSGAIHRGNSLIGPEEEWYDNQRRATSSYTREYVRNLPTSIPNSTSFVVGRTRSQTRPVGRCLSTNTNTDSGLEQSSYSSQSSDKSDILPLHNKNLRSTGVTKDPFTVIRPSLSYNQLSRISNNNVHLPEPSAGYDLPPRSNNMINTKTFRKSHSSRSITGSPEPPLYSSHSKLNGAKGKLNFEDDDELDDECENKDPRKVLQEQRELLIRKNQEQKQLQEEMQQREKELLRKIQEQQKELELVKKNQIKVASIPSNERRQQKPTRNDVNPPKNIVNVRRPSTDGLPQDNSRIDRNYLRRKVREDPNSNWDSNDKRNSPARGQDNLVSRVNGVGIRQEQPSNRRESDELRNVKINNNSNKYLAEGSKTLPSRRKSSASSMSKKSSSTTSSNLSNSTTNLNQSRRSVFQPKPRDDLDQCPYCERNFAKDRIEKHTAICNKSGKKKRKTFDMTKKRVQGTEAEAFLKRASKIKKPQKEPKKSDWRKKREEFIAALRAAKEAQRHIAAGGKISDLPPPPPMDTSDYIQCPHCNRKFNEAAAERHIPKCKDIRSNKRR